MGICSSVLSNRKTTASEAEEQRVMEMSKETAVEASVSDLRSPDDRLSMTLEKVKKDRQTRLEKNLPMMVDLITSTFHQALDESLKPDNTTGKAKDHVKMDKYVKMDIDAREMRAFLSNPTVCEILDALKKHNIPIHFQLYTEYDRFVCSMKIDIKSDTKHYFVIGHPVYELAEAKTLDKMRELLFGKADNA